MTEQNKALARRFIEDVWNAGNLAAADDLLAPGLITHDQPPGQTLSGAAAFKDYIREFRDRHPRVEFAVEDMVAEGDRVATRVTIRHAGGTYSGIGIVRISDGRIAEQWADTNRLGG
jgi:predicted SnoaL-like aldol condensation-catalyzing enzyme